MNDADKYELLFCHYDLCACILPWSCNSPYPIQQPQYV